MDRGSDAIQGDDRISLPSRSGRKNNPNLEVYLNPEEEEITGRFISLA